MTSALNDDSALGLLSAEPEAHKRQVSLSNSERSIVSSSYIYTSVGLWLVTLRLKRSLHYLYTACDLEPILRSTSNPAFGSRILGEVEPGEYYRWY